MVKTSNKKIKFFFLGFLILIFVSLFVSIYFMTPYANIHVYFTSTGYNSGTTFVVGDAEFANTHLYNFMKSTKVIDKPDFEMTADMIFNFQNAASNYNNLLIIGFVVALVVYGLLILFANNSRRIFYKSNAVGGVIIPLILVGYSVYTLAMGFSLLGDFMANENAYKAASVMMNQTVATRTKNNIINGTTYRGHQYTWQDVLDNSGDVNSLAIILTIAIQVLLVAYAVAIMIFSVMKYKKTAEERKAIIERAANTNV